MSICYPMVIPVAAAGGGCAESAAFLARTSGLNAGHQTAYQTLICGLVTDGVWTKLDALWVFATADRTTAKLNLVSASFPCTEQGTVNFTADRGYIGNGTDFFLNTQLTPSAGGLNYVQDSASQGVYELSNIIEFKELMGSFNTIQTALAAQVISTLGQASLNAGGAGNFNPTTTKSNGFWAITRTASNLQTWYENGGSAQTDTHVSVGLDGVPRAIFGRMLTAAPTADNFSSAELSAAFMGGGLTATDIGNLSNRLNAYMTTYSINQY